VTQQDSPRDSQFFSTKDQDTVITLMSYKHYPSKTTRRGRIVTFFFDAKDVDPLLQMWLSGKPLPVSDIRVVYEAYRQFNRIIFEGA